MGNEDQPIKESTDPKKRPVQNIQPKKNTKFDKKRSTNLEAAINRHKTQLTQIKKYKQLQKMFMSSKNIHKFSLFMILENEKQKNKENKNPKKG